jgi:hypothetical protein|tara:strand:- start:32 stop:430 length:399 start_codon:yes stop_codon:yes gene_type:complete
MKILLLALMSITFTSCGSYIIDGNCVLSKVTKDNATYYVGPCFGKEGEVEKVKARWENGEGIEFQVSISRNSVIDIQYKVPVDPVTGNDLWVSWSSKSGVMLGTIPVELEEVIGNPFIAVDTDKLLKELSTN